jgi:hypothetical protein
MKDDLVITEANKVAMCVSCLVADALKYCEKCAFKTGRAVRAVHLETLKLSVEEREKFWDTLPEPLWDAYWEYAFAKETVRPGKYSRRPQKVFSLEEECLAEAAAGCNQ